LDNPELCAKLIIEFVEQIQDKTWAIKAQKAEQMGFLTAKDSEAFLKSLG
jgi:hypothetical protein